MYSEEAQAFAEFGTVREDEDLAAQYDDIAANMLTPRDALVTLIDHAAEPFAFTRGTDHYNRLMSALYHASISFADYQLDDANRAFGRGAR